MKFISTTALVLVWSLAGCAPSAGIGELGPNTFSDWDANADACLDRNEFGVNWNNEFGVWDDDDSGFVENDEWGVEVGLNNDDFGTFGTWDTTDDNLLDANEFGVGAFGGFDDNLDNCIRMNEWNAGIGMWD